MARDSHNELQPWQVHALDAYIPGMAAPSAPAPAAPQERFQALLRRRKLMLITLVTVFAGGMFYTLTRRPIYESTAKIVVASNSGGPAVADDITLLSDLRALTRSRSVETQVEMVSSPDLLKEAFDLLSPDMRARGFRSLDRIPDWSTKISARKNTDVILVTARAYTPAAAATLANVISREYLKRDVARNNQATRQARQYAGQQMIQAERDLAYAQNDLAAFKRKSGLFAPEAQLNKTAEEMAQLSMDLAAAKAQYAAERKQAGAMAGALSKERSDVVASTTVARNPEFEAVRQRISDLNGQRIALLQEFTPTSIEVKTLDQRIRQEEARLKQIAQNVVGATVSARNPVRDALLTNYANTVASASASGGRVGALSSALASRRSVANSLPERERGYTERAQKVAQLQRTYETLATKYNALLLTEQSTLPSGLLASRARIAEKPAYPKRASNTVLFFLLGCLAAAAAAMVAERLDRRVTDESDVIEMTRLPSLSVVPESSDDSPLLLTDPGAKPAMLESFRILRSSIQFCGDQTLPRIIAVTSPGRGEGKSTTTVNLAVAMAMEGKKVLLVDGDLRRPSLHRLLNLPTRAGLSTTLIGTTTADDCIVKTQVENVWCLPSGPTPPNGAELLNSVASRVLFKQLAEQYDVVIVDSPPSTGLCDIQVISGLTDGVLLVVSMNQTLKPQLNLTLRTLAYAGAKVIGVVVNRAETRHWGYGYYDYCEESQDAAASGRRNSRKESAAAR